MHCNHGHLSGPGLLKVMISLGYHVTIHEVHEATRHCPFCLLTKGRRASRNKSPATRPSHANQVISPDFLFVDEFTACLIVDRFSKWLSGGFFKSDTVTVLEQYLQDAKATHSGGIKRIHSDHEAVLNSADMKASRI